MLVGDNKAVVFEGLRDDGALGGSKESLGDDAVILAKGIFGDGVISTLAGIFQQVGSTGWIMSIR